MTPKLRAAINLSWFFIKLDLLSFEPINLVNTLLSSNILKQMSVQCICFSPSRFSPPIITQLSQISQYK